MIFYYFKLSLFVFKKEKLIKAKIL